MDDKEKVQTILDEEAFAKGFKENHGIFLITGALYRTSTITKIHQGCFAVSLISLFLCLCKTAFLLRSDTMALFETIHWATISLACFISVMISFPNTVRYNRIFTIFGKGIYTYVAADEETSEEIEALRHQGEEEKQLLIKLFTVMVFSAYCGFVFLFPAYSIYTGEFFKPQRSDGIVMGVPCVLWIPTRVNPDKIVAVRIIIILVQAYISGTIINMLLGQQGSAIWIGHKLYYEFKVLAVTLKKIKKIASELQAGDRLTGKDEAMEEYLKRCFKEAVLHHEILMSIAKDYSGIFFVHELSLLIASTVLICLSGLSLVSDVPMTGRIMSMLLAGTELCNVFVGCFYGELLLDSHRLLAEALYDSEWTAHIRAMGTHMLITLARLQKPLSLSAGGFANVNLDMFAQVVKTSFSYFSLLQALKE